MNRIISNKMRLLRSVIRESEKSSIRNLLCAVNYKDKDKILPYNYKNLIVSMWYPSQQIFSKIDVYDKENNSVLEVSVYDRFFLKFEGIKYNIFYMRKEEDIYMIRNNKDNNPSIIIAYDYESIKNIKENEGELIITENKFYEILNDPSIKWRKIFTFPQTIQIMITLFIMGMFEYKK